MAISIFSSKFMVSRAELSAEVKNECWERGNALSFFLSRFGSGEGDCVNEVFQKARSTLADNFMGVCFLSFEADSFDGGVRSFFYLTIVMEQYIFYMDYYVI